MHAEEEAKKLWCPYGAGAKQIGALGENGQPMSAHIVLNTAHCIASACAAWRWADVTPPAAGEYRQGFCGLAGKP